MKKPIHVLLGIAVISAALLYSSLGSPPSLAAAGDPTSAIYLPVIQNAPTPTPMPSGPDWLVYLNSRRQVGGLPALTENSAWSDGCWKHARYMVKNDVIAHSEDPTNPWYSTEGNQAAGNSNVMVSSSTSYSDQRAMDLWLTGPFHGVGVLDPQLASTGFGSYREAIGVWQMGACLDVLRGLGALPPNITFPILWPGNGAVMPYLSYSGGEYPDPIQGCGYSPPSGAPIYLMLGAGDLTPNITSHSFRRGNTELEHCVYTENTFNLPGDPGGQNLGRAVLNSRDAVILIPRSPLAAGTTYTASITANGIVYTWSFTTTTSPIQADPLEAVVRQEAR